MIKNITLDNPTIAKQVHALQKTAYALESELVGFEVPTMRETIQDLQASPYSYYAFIFEAQIIGVCALEILPSTSTITIAKLFVSPDHFRKGIGKTLLGFTESLTLLKGFKKLTVGTASLNIPAITLYIRMGYQLVKMAEVAPSISLSYFEKEFA